MKNYCRLVGLMVVLCANAQDKKGKEVVIDLKDGHSVVCKGISSASSIRYADHKKSHGSRLMFGTNINPKHDVVAVYRSFQPLSVVAEDQREILIRERPQRFRYSLFTPVHDNKAYEAADLKFSTTENPYLIKEAVCHTKFLYALERLDVTYPAVVNEEFQPFDAEMKIRIRKLYMSKDRELEVRIDYKRPRSGTESAFIDAVYALDKNGMILGGARWTTGSPFDDSGSVTAKFPLKSHEFHRSFKVVAVNKSVERKVEFTLTDIFKF